MESMAAEAKAEKFLDDAHKMCQYEGQEFWLEAIRSVVYALLFVGHTIKENSDEK